MQVDCKKEFECPSCFFVWLEPSGNVVGNGIFSKLCDYCENNQHLTRNTVVTAYSIALLKRRIDVINTAYAFRFPQVIQHLFEHIKLEPYED